jgi:hypothetical protein
MEGAPMSARPERVQKIIGRLNWEIKQIEATIYGTEESEPLLIAIMLERKRDDIVRSAVLQLHTKIEDLLTQLILFCTLDIRSEKAEAQARRRKGKGISPDAL